MSRKKACTEKELLVLMQKIVSLFSVVGVEDKEVMTGLSLCADERTDFRNYEDALQYICAKKVKSALIVTNDKGFVGLDIEVIGSKS